MNKDLHFSSATGDWATPQDFFDEVNRQFNFASDVAASEANAKCDLFYDGSEGLDGLVETWGINGGPAWCNPPYGRGIGVWINKAIVEKLNRHPSVLLVPARTDTKWFRLAFENAAKLWFVPGRLKFGGCKDAAPFPSALFYFTHKIAMPCQVAYWR